MNASIENALNNYMDAIRKNYADWNRSGGTSEVREKMIEEFEANYTKGKKYIRVSIKSSNQETVHSFVVNTENDKFPYGTILKPASWKTPARNKARGNVFEDVSHISWTQAI